MADLAGGKALYKDVTDTHVLIRDKINLDFVVRNLANSTEDTVVNSTGTSINFSIPLSKAIAAKAGPDLKKACTALVPLSFGSVAETSGFKMPCKQILHCNCHHWRDGKNSKALKKIIVLCLEKSGKEAHKSIAFPAIGMGAKAFPAKNVAESVVEAISEFSGKHPDSTLRTVKIYIYEKDATSTLMQIFKETLCALKKKEGPQIMKMVIGDLAETKAAILVNSTGSQMTLSGGSISLALLNKAGRALQEECNKCTPLLDGEIVATDGFGLACDKVLHVSCPTWKKGTTEKKLQDLIKRCLNWAKSLSASSIAFPAMGTGILRYPPESVAQCFSTAFAAFATDHPDSCVKDIKVVVYAKDSSTISGFEKALGIKLQVQTEEEIRRYKPTVFVDDGNKVVIDLPSYWQTPVHEYREFIIAAGCKEWTDAITDFKKTLNTSSVEIVQLIRVQNPETYMLYDVRRKSVAMKLNKQEHEIEAAPLWHGSKEENVPQITRTKFDRAVSGSVGANILGAGSYFSTTSQYSSNDKYSPPNASGVKYMILARVITGEYCLGNGDYKMAPYKPGSSFEQYESVVNRVNDPTMYAVFHDASAYPEYVIKYKLTK